MPRNSGLTTRDVVNHGSGKGDKPRVTDVLAYRDNFDEIDWKSTGRNKTKTLRDLEDEFEFRHGL